MTFGRERQVADADEVRTLIHRGARVNPVPEVVWEERYPDAYGAPKTMLHAALRGCTAADGSFANHNGIQVVNALLNAGADVNMCMGDDGDDFRTLMQELLNSIQAFPIEQIIRQERDVSISAFATHCEISMRLLRTIISKTPKGFDTDGDKAVGDWARKARLCNLLHQNQVIWGPATHEQFPRDLRCRAVQLVMVGHRLRESMGVPLDLWVARIMPQAIHDHLFEHAECARTACALIAYTMEVEWGGGVHDTTTPDGPPCIILDAYVEYLSQPDEQRMSRAGRRFRVRPAFVGVLAAHVASLHPTTS